MRRPSSYERRRHQHTSSLWKKFALLLLAAALLSPRAARSQDRKDLYLGTPARSVAWFPLFVAMKKGFFQKEGLFVQPVIMDSRVIVPALTSKEIPYSTGMGSTMIGAARGLPLKVVTILGAKTHLVLVTRPEITSFKELRGRTVAITRPGSDVHRMLMLVARKFDVDPHEIKVLGVGDLINRVNVLKRKVVDAAVLSIPYDFLAEKDGFKRLLYFKEFIDVPIMGITTHDDRIRERREEVKKIIAATLRGIAYTKSHEQEMLPLLQGFVGLENLQVARRAYEAIRDMWPDTGLPSDEGLRNAIAVAEIAPTVPLDQLVNWAPLKEVLATRPLP